MSRVTRRHVAWHVDLGGDTCQLVHVCVSLVGPVPSVGGDTAAMLSLIMFLLFGLLACVPGLPRLAAPREGPSCRLPLAEHQRAAPLARGCTCLAAWILAPLLQWSTPAHPTGVYFSGDCRVTQSEAALPRGTPPSSLEGAPINSATTTAGGTPSHNTYACANATSDCNGCGVHGREAWRTKPSTTACPPPSMQASEGCPWHTSPGPPKNSTEQRRTVLTD